MIPSATHTALSNRRKEISFDPAGDYALTGSDLSDLEALMRRMYQEQRLEPGEARDWGNRLYAMLNHAIQM